MYIHIYTQIQSQIYSWYMYVRLRIKKKHMYAGVIKIDLICVDAVRSQPQLPLVRLSWLEAGWLPSWLEAGWLSCSILQPPLRLSCSRSRSTGGLYRINPSSFWVLNGTQRFWLCLSPVSLAASLLASALPSTLHFSGPYPSCSDYFYFLAWYKPSLLPGGRRCQWCLGMSAFVHKLPWSFQQSLCKLRSAYAR